MVKFKNVPRNFNKMFHGLHNILILCSVIKRNYLKYKQLSTTPPTWWVQGRVSSALNFF